MNKHLSAIELERYRQGQLSLPEAEAHENHLAECPACRAAVKPAASAAAAMHWRAELNAAAREEFCLTEEQIFRCLKEEPTPAVKLHLAACAECQSAVREMREVRDSLSATPLQAPVSKTGARQRGESVRGHRFFHGWNRSKAAWAAAVLALAAVFLWQARQAVLQWDRARDLTQTVTPTPLPQVSVSPAVVAPSATLPVVSLPVVSLPVVSLNDGGGQIGLDEQGNLFGLGQLPEEVMPAVKAALQTQKVKLSPVSAELNQGSSSLMDAAGADKSFRVLQPVAKVLRTARPEFRWQPLAGATSYTVTVFQTDFSEIAVSPPLTETFWKPETPLPAGRVLFWQVRAVSRDEERVTPSLADSPAKFKVLEKQINDRLEGIERMHADSHLALGVLYAEAGLKEEAAAQFRALLKANPQSPLARKLLAGVGN